MKPFDDGHGWLRGDFAVTPTGRSAKVLRVLRDGYVELAYLGRSDDFVTLQARLLKPWKPTATRQ